MFGRAAKTASQGGLDRPAGLDRKVALARAALWWEATWRALWPVAAITGLFVAVALLDVLPRLPGWLHALVLLGFVAALAAAAWRAVRALVLPGPAAGRRRLEQASELQHRPLLALDDELATGAQDWASAALWRAHRRRLLAQVARLRVGLPRPGLVRLDSLALRTLVILLLFVGLAVGREEWAARLASAVTPSLALGPPAAPASLTVWIDPPDYTRLPPLYLDPAAGSAPGEGSPPAESSNPAEDGTLAEVGAKPVEIPLGSTILAQVQGGRGVPQLDLGVGAEAFGQVAADTYEITRVLDSGERLVVVQDKQTLADWPVRILPDAAPDIVYLSPPSRTQRQILRLEYQAEDDYGLVEVSAEIRRVDKPEAAPLEIELLLPGAGLRQAENASYHDLTPHPWAGMAVDITLRAVDALGQVGRSDPARTVLPERIFNHPVARALVELRKQLTLDPGARLPIVRRLNQLYSRPEHFFHDVVVALAMRIAERRLIYDSSAAAITQVQELLWDTALHIEEGELAIAERDLRELYEELMRALAEGAPDQEIEELMDKLSQALERYMQALAEQMQERLAQGAEPQPLPPNAQLIPSERLQEMLQRARELARSGAREAARDLLARLQDLLENLQSAPFAQMQDQNGESAWQMMNEMESLMQRQQELLDRSHQRAQERPGGEQGEGQRGGDPNGENYRDSLAQESLRRDLGEVMRRLGDALGEIPRPLGRAEQAMRDARRALEHGEPSNAVGPQTRALDQLMQGMQSMAESFMEQMGNNQQAGSGPLGVNPGQNRDPLGRDSGNMGPEALEGVQIPDEMELRRAREILDELRRRRGQRTRPPQELDYIDRLLQQF